MCPTADIRAIGCGERKRMERRIEFLPVQGGDLVPRGLYQKRIVSVVEPGESGSFDTSYVFGPPSDKLVITEDDIRWLIGGENT